MTGVKSRRYTNTKMIGKKINQLATELAPVSTDLTIIGDPISGVSKKITLAQLGAIFSGAVSFYDNLASFPATGDINVIYCAKDTKKLYLWSGSAYVEVFPSQALLDTYQLRSEKGVSNGYASLDSGGKVPISQLPSSIMEYKGTWNAATNTPTLANGTGDTGDVYICNVAGTVNFGAGPITFAVGDYVIYSGSIWQRSSGAVGTVTSVGLSITGDSIGVSNSPITTSGTLALAFAGTSSQYINGAGNLTTFPTLTGYVPYTGATANVDLGTFDLTADIITAATGSYTSSGGGNTLEVTHSSGSGIALNITKGGNGEGLYINKTSGSGNAATIVGTLEATTLVKTGGTSSQFLKADGSVDSSTYVTTDTFQNISASKTFAVGFNIASAGGTNQITNFANTNSLFSGSGGSNVFGFNSANNIYFGKGLDNGGVLQWNNSAVRYYTLPDATGTIALVGGAGVGTVTSVGLSSATSGVTIGSTPITTSGTITLAIATASGSQQGLLSSTDWTTFNNKQDALTNPVTGTGTTNYLPKFTGTSTIGNSIVQDNGYYVGFNFAGSGSLGGQNFGVDSVGAFQNNLGSYGYRWLVNNGTNELMRLNASGNLMLGGTTQLGKATIIGDNNDANSGQLVIAGATSTNKRTSIGYNTTGNYGFISVYTALSGYNPLALQPLGGNVGIGTTSPGALLHVGGTSGNTLPTNAQGIFEFNSNGGIAVSVPTGNAGGIYFPYSTSAYYAGVDRYLTDLRFLNGDAVRLTIASTGAATFSSSVTAGGTVISRTANYPQIVFQETTSSTDSLIFYDNAAAPKQMGFRVNSASNVLTLTSTNVGIGTTSPSALTEIRVNTNDYGNNLLLANNYPASGVGSSISFSHNTQAADPDIIARVSGYIDDRTSGARAGSLRFYTGNAGTLGERLRITSSGDLLFKGASTTSLAEAVFQNSNSEVSIYGSQTGSIVKDITFHSGGTAGLERMRITSGGALLVGTTSELQSATSKLNIAGDFYNANGVSLKTTNGGSGSQFVGFINESGTLIGSINRVTTTNAVAYNTTSDYRLKEDLKSINGLEIVNKIKVYDYKWKADNSRMDGVLAHELAEVLPYAVTGIKDGEKMQQVDYSKIVPVLIQSVKELKAELDTLKNK